MTQRIPSRLARAIPLLAVLALAACQSVPPAAGVTRYANAGANAITSKAVEISAGSSLIFVSGNTPMPAQPNAAQYSPEYWGDTEAQTRSALKKIEAALRDMKLGMADVVKVQAFVVAPDGAKAADLAGFNKGFGAYFGAASRGMLPSRTAVQVAALGHPGLLVEIEVTAVRPAAPPSVATSGPGHAGHDHLDGHP